MKAQPPVPLPLLRRDRRLVRDPPHRPLPPWHVRLPRRRRPLDQPRDRLHPRAGDRSLPALPPRPLASDDDRGCVRSAGLWGAWAWVLVCRFRCACSPWVAVPPASLGAPPPQPASGANRFSSFLVACKRWRGVAFQVPPATRFERSATASSTGPTSISRSTFKRSGVARREPTSRPNPQSQSPCRGAPSKGARLRHRCGLSSSGCLPTRKIEPTPTPHMAAIGYGPPRSSTLPDHRCGRLCGAPRTADPDPRHDREGWHSDARRTRTGPKGTLPAGHGDHGAAQAHLRQERVSLPAPW
jgi:hypothetical protein